MYCIMFFLCHLYWQWPHINDFNPHQKYWNYVLYYVLALSSHPSCVTWNSKSPTKYFTHPPRSIGIMYCIMYVSNLPSHPSWLPGIDKGPSASIKKYWNYVLHYVLSPSLRYWKGTLRTSPPQVLELCMALLCHPSWVPRTRTLHPHPHKYYNCVLYYVFFLPFLANWPTSPSPVKYYRHVLELCIVLGLTIIAFSVETKPNNTTIYWVWVSVINNLPDWMYYVLKPT